MDENIKNIGFTRTTASAVIAVDAVYVYQVIITSDGVGNADGDLYNGEGTGGEHKQDLRAVTSESQPYKFNPPLYFSRGCYVEHGSNVKSITVQWARAE